MVYQPTVIDLSRVPAPDAVQIVSFEEKRSEFIDRFLTFWDDARLIDTTLPPFDVSNLGFNPAVILAEAWSYLRLLDLQRVNDGIKGLLAPLARKNDLDNIVAGRNITRLVSIPASGDTPAVMESDSNLLRRYLLSFDNRAAGSRDRYLYEAYTAWPLEGVNVAVNGFAVHGRRGDVDIVISGPGGRAATPEEKTAVRLAVQATNVRPEATSVAVIDATRLLFDVSLIIRVAIGPDPDVIKDEAEKRIRAAAAARMIIGGKIPAGLLAGAAYGDSVIEVVDQDPVIIAAEPYTIPILDDLNIEVEIAT